MTVVKAIPPQCKQPPLKKVAAYCRVSTKSQEQLDSLAAQERYYEERIKANPHWKFAGIYADIGSGTTIKGRKRFNALLSACRRGKVDMVLIKSAHRFARNTVDALETIRMLRRWKVDIYFETDDIHTLYESSEFMLTLICARAQDESESKSADIKWGIRKSFADPDSRYYQRVCYGYKHDKEGRLIIDEEKAEIVRMIFRLSGEGASLSQIAQELQDQGIPSPREKSVWSKETLRKILNNEKYFGKVIFQKTFVADCLSHKQIKNTGQHDKYEVVDNHKPIIMKKCLALQRLR